MTERGLAAFGEPRCRQRFRSLLYPLAPDVHLPRLAWRRSELRYERQTGCAQGKRTEGSLLTTSRAATEDDHS